MNQMLGFLLERGITMRKGPSHLAAQLQIAIGGGNCSFSSLDGQTLLVKLTLFQESFARIYGKQRRTVVLEYGR
jgi:hypothetical protein